MEIPVENLERLIEFAGKYRITPTKREEREILGNAISELKEPHQKIASAFRITEFLIDNFTEIEDEPETIIDDFEKLGYNFVCDNAEFYKKYLEKVIEITKFKIKPFVRKKATSQSGIKVLTSIDTNVDLRVILEKDFDLLKDDVDKFQPIYSGLVPVIIIEIGIGEDEKMVFQVDERLLELMIKELGSAKKVLENIKMQFEF